MPVRMPALLADPLRARGRQWLTGGRLFDGTGAPSRDGTAVLIEDGIIEAIVYAGDVPSGDPSVLDLAGRTLMPGLIDAHVHVKADLPQTDRGAEPLLEATTGHLVAADLREALHRGITTVRDVGSYGDLVFGARQAMRYGAFRGPRLLTCGSIVSATAPGGRFFAGMYREADGCDDVRRAVREQIRRGADFIKVMTTGARSVELEDPNPAQMTREEIATLVDEAHRQGYRVAAHCEGLAGSRLAIEERIDTIEHGMYLNQKPALLEQMARQGQVLVPTLSCFYGVAGRERAVGAGPHADGESDLEGNANLDDGLHTTACAPAPWSPPLVRLAEHNLAQAGLTLRAARAIGVRIAAGHDWHPIWDHALEIRRMIAHGLSAAEALAAATSGGAYALGLADNIGTVAKGRTADLLILDGDPLSRPELLSQRDAVWLVMKGGRQVAGTALERTVGAADRRRDSAGPHG